MEVGRRCEWMEVSRCEWMEGCVDGWMEAGVAGWLEGGREGGANVWSLLAEHRARV